MLGVPITPANDAVERPSEWRKPKPDQVLYMRDTPFAVPSQGVVDYQRFIVDPGWDEELPEGDVKIAINAVGRSFSVPWIARQPIPKPSRVLIARYRSLVESRQSPAVHSTWIGGSRSNDVRIDSALDRFTPKSE